MEHKLHIDKLREAVDILGEAAGQAPAEALLLIDQLEQELDHLRGEVKRLKLESARKAAAVGSMNSRLKDALRE